MDNNSRTIPSYLAGILEQLELDQPDIVSLGDIANYAATVGSPLVPARAAHELKKRGWLIPTSQRGYYEFSPGANAGAFSRGGKTADVKALAAAHPEIEWCYAFQSALYYHGIVDQIPDEPQFSVRANNVRDIPVSFRKYTKSAFFYHLSPEIIEGNPVECIETLLVHICAKPGQVGDWFLYEEHLPLIWNGCNEDKVVEELSGRSTATIKRLAYLLSGVALEFSLRIDTAPGYSVHFVLPVNPILIKRKGHA
jgi:predicted transcriptional regulator of viral defense system